MKLNIPEEFLHYIWEHRLFEQQNLLTTRNEPLEIIDVGRRNSDAGPDFFNARIKIDETIWAGNVEIHKNASDWHKHKHTNDRAYDNVILHVVNNADASILRHNDEEIPTHVLQYPKHLEENFGQLLEAQTWIPCQNQFHKVDPLLLQLSYNRLMIERLENKTADIETRLERNKNNWNETFYQMLARMFGMKVNAVPFELLAKSLPLQILGKHKNSLFQIEALLFGNAGLLNRELIGDDYFLKLRDEYSFLYKKYKLKPIDTHLWKFMRLRPVNFPTVRLAQFAALIHHSHGLFSKITSIEKLAALRQLFKVQASEYWDSHYNFNKASKETGPKELGETASNLLIINVAIPFLFVFGESQHQEQLKNRALEFLDQLPPEKNSIIDKWKKLGVSARSAFETQALLQLKNCYCETKKCLNCPLGAKLISARHEKEQTTGTKHLQ